MSRLKICFEALTRTRRKALIAFITAGDPNPDFTIPMLHGLVSAGTDIIELGVPFSDPMADGPVIQRASERALAHQMRLSKVLQLVAQFRKTNQTTPIILMGYLNPIEIMGYKAFAHAAKEAQVDGVLTVDLPPEEAQIYVSHLKASHIDPIFLLAPNTPLARIKKINAIASGYLYYVSLKGVTGASHINITEVQHKLTTIKENTDLPVVVGFGIKDAKAAKVIAEFADGIVIGSAFIQKIEENIHNPEKAKTAIIALTQSMRQALL